MRRGAQCALEKDEEGQGSKAIEAPLRMQRTYPLRMQRTYPLRMQRTYPLRMQRAYPLRMQRT